MAREVQKISVNFPGKLKVTTGEAGDETVYEIDPLQGGVRKIRKRGEEITGHIVGAGLIMAAQNSFGVTDFENIKVGLGMSVARGAPPCVGQGYWGSRPIIKIEIIEE
ncbi:hypothetical protein ACFL0L_05375 [Patescibacteria group bacterium]